MDDLNANIDGSIVLDRDVRFFGSIRGTLTVPSGRRFELHGNIDHDLIVEKGAVVVIHGTIRGALINKGGDVLLNGIAGRIEDLDSGKPVRRNIQS